MNKKLQYYYWLTLAYVRQFLRTYCFIRISFERSLIELYFKSGYNYLYFRIRDPRTGKYPNPSWIVLFELKLRGKTLTIAYPNKGGD